MKYQIMFVAANKENLETAYKFETTDVDGTIQYKYYTTDLDLENRVKDLLNNGYAKSDFIIVTVKDYNIETDIYIEPIE